MATRTVRHPVQEESVMPLSLAERQAVLRELAGPYRRARKHERSQILNHVQTLCGFNRAYAARALRTALPRNAVPARGRAGAANPPMVWRRKLP